MGTSYPIIVDDVTELLSKPPLRYGHLAIDATGVGRPVVDMFVKAGLAVDLVPVVITAGRKQSYQDGYYHVAKAILVSNLLKQLQERRLRFAQAMPETAVLIRELQSYRVKVTAAAHEVFNARNGCAR